MSVQQAAEQLSFDQTLAKLPHTAQHAKKVLARIARVAAVPARARILDIGAAQGRFVVGCAQLGHEVIGVEPWAQARSVATRLADHVGVTIEVVEGTAEALPFPDATFDVVHAMSVMEHVRDARAAFREAQRVLKPGGAFWFSTASSLCPSQSEIRGFPAFGWYPDPLKIRIMEWAKANRPALIGHTEMPAIHWFTPWKARRMLLEAGFTRVYDRWDLRLPSEGGRLYRLALGVVRSSPVMKLITDVIVPECSFGAVK